MSYVYNDLHLSAHNYDKDELINITQVKNNAFLFVIPLDLGRINY